MESNSNSSEPSAQESTSTPVTGTKTPSDDQTAWTEEYAKRLKWSYQSQAYSMYPLVFPKDVSDFQRGQFAQRQSCWDKFLNLRGTRYEGCRLANYQVTTEAQKTAMTALQKFVYEIRDRWLAGCGVVLYGSKGTGKDHLMMGLARFAFGQCQWVTWINGTDLFAKFRDSFDNDKQGEETLIRRYGRCPILWISDPIPAAGRLTDYQGSTLFSIIDYRYRENLPTWITVNVAGATEFQERILPQNADRLRDGSLCIHCNWESYRKPAQSIH